MPYKIGTHPDCPVDKPHALLKEGTGERMGCHATEADARKQMAALMAQEKPMDQMRSTGDQWDIRSSELWEDARFQVETEGDGLTMFGPMALFNAPSRLLSVADLGDPQARSQLARFGKRAFREVIHPGAFTRSLKAAPDIVLHYQHDERSLPLGRTKAGTLRLTEDANEVRASADLPDNEWGRPVRDAVKRGDIGGISFRMGSVTDSWEKESLPDGYKGPVRHLHEIQLRREISLVTFPGYETSAAIRQLAEDADLEPDQLATVFTKLRDPEGRLSNEERDLLMTAVNARVDEPYIDPKLAQMRARMLELATA